MKVYDFKGNVKAVTIGLGRMSVIECVGDVFVGAQQKLSNRSKLDDKEALLSIDFAYGWPWLSRPRV
jgi:hypothetical protein